MNNAVLSVNVHDKLTFSNKLSIIFVKCANEIVLLYKIKLNRLILAFLIVSFIELYILQLCDSYYECNYECTTQLLDLYVFIVLTTPTKQRRQNRAIKPIKHHII